MTRWSPAALGRRPLLTAVVDLHGGSAASVRLIPSPTRWPEHEGADRLALPVWFAALTLANTTGSLSARIRHRVMALAAALAGSETSSGDGPTWPEFVAGRRLLPPAHEGQPRVTVRLTRASRLRPTVVGDVPSPLSLAAATAAAAGISLEGHGESGRMAAALALECLLIRHREEGIRDASAAEAVGTSLRYALNRLEEAGRPVPADLAVAVSSWE